MQERQNNVVGRRKTGVENMSIDPMQMRVAVVKKEFMENAARDYKQAGFTLEECVETCAKQFHVGKKTTRELVKKIYKE